MSETERPSCASVTAVPAAVFKLLQYFKVPSLITSFHDLIQLLNKKLLFQTRVPIPKRPTLKASLALSLPVLSLIIIFLFIPGSDPFLRRALPTSFLPSSWLKATLATELRGNYALVFVSMHAVSEPRCWPALEKVSHNISSVIGTKRGFKTESNYTYLKRLPHYTNNLKRSNVYKLQSKACVFPALECATLFSSYILFIRRTTEKRNNYPVFPQKNKKATKTAVLRDAESSQAAGAQSQPQGSLCDIGCDEWNMKVAQTVHCTCAVTYPRGPASRHCVSCMGAGLVH